jgi:CheY-like chemotaxis protein
MAPLMRFRGKVLLAEDDPVNQAVAAEMLQLLGADVDCASDGGQALALLKAGRFDLALLDVQMPVLDGTEVARALREWERSERRPSTPIVALTANATPDDRRECLASGMDSFVAKPVSLQALTAVLASHLRPADD